MNDLEICKKIAEIESIPNLYFQFGEVRVCVHDGDDYYYNPLTDDALCFRLMVKYEVEAYPLVVGLGCKHMAISHTFNGCDGFIEFKGYAETLNKAICLAIIEAHKE